MIFVNTSAKTLLLQTTDASGTGTVVTVSVPGSATVVSAAGGSLSLSKLAIGDELIVYGAYSAGTFNATVVIRK
ncbi:hypothetical protein SDC9_166623 [bioreactor metagenome]|uniref:DUF5666 domain-containing protein n=1 Tax=bioreactor metagenome TaxID=1076179 RepID=A0A645FZA4_9ZZZZ